MQRSDPGTAVREIVWTPVWNPDRSGWGIELLRLSNTHARSTAILFDGTGTPFQLDYDIEWDERWSTLRVHIEARRRDDNRRLDLVRDSSGMWRDGTSSPLPAFEGCHEVDIWPTPFTNTLPIRRLELDVGRRAEVRVIYIEAPELTTSVTTQAYTRTAPDRYLFDDLAGFEAELTVDPDGIVIDYPGLFRRLV